MNGVLVAWFFVAHPALARAPQTAISGTCQAQVGGYADLDSDGVDDLVLVVGDVVFAWPSTRVAPIQWVFPADFVFVDLTSASESHPAQLQAFFNGTGLFTEYAVLVDSLELQERWTDADLGSPLYMGDVDGDGWSDMGTYSWRKVRYSGTGEVTTLPQFLPEGTAPTDFAAVDPFGVGDLNGDGYDDAVITYRALYSYDLPYPYWAARYYGPLVLALGSPTGFQPEPLWVIDFPPDPWVGVGRQTVVMPDGQTLIVTLVEEDWLFYPDWSDGFLGVIRDAGRADAYLDQVVLAAPFEPGGNITLLGGFENEDGTIGLPLIEESGSDRGLVLFNWDPTRVPSLTEEAVSAWVAGEYVRSTSFLWRVAPLGGVYEAYANEYFTPWDPGWELLVWGRSPEEVGFGPGLTSTVGDCTWTARPFTGGPPAPEGPPDTAGSPPVPEPEGCAGCSTSPGPLWLVTIAALGLARSGGRSRRGR